MYKNRRHLRQQELPMKIPYRISIVLICLSLVLAATFSTAEDAAKKDFTEWKFAVISDTQGDRSDESNKSCINDAIVCAIAADIAKAKPELVLVSGDLVNGWFRNGGTDYATQYANWKRAMDPVFSSGIKVFAVRGNHDDGPERFVLPPLPEKFEPTPESLKQLKIEYKKAVVRAYTPMNGPVNEKGLTYSFVYRNALVIGLDQFTDGQHKVNQEWLDAQLSGNSAVHLFVFGHEPAFEADHRDNLSFYADRRDLFWNSIGRAGCRIYFCGHDHFYNRALITDSHGLSMWQIIAGTGGARLRDWSGSYIEKERAGCEYYNNKYHGYVLVTVKGNAVNVEWRALVDPAAGTWQALDKFSYTALTVSTGL